MSFISLYELSPFCCKPIKLTKLIKLKNKRPRRRLWRAAFELS